MTPESKAAVDLEACRWCQGRGWYWAAGPGERHQARCDVCQPEPHAESTAAGTPASSGEGPSDAVVRAFIEASSQVSCGPVSDAAVQAFRAHNPAYAGLLAALAALPPSSGWEAGAQDAALREAVYALERIDCLREVCTNLSQAEMAYKMRSIAKQSLAEIRAIRATSAKPPTADTIGWEAGAEAMRDALYVAVSRYDLTVSDDRRPLLNGVLKDIATCPLPPPPSREGA